MSIVFSESFTPKEEPKKQPNVGSVDALLNGNEELKTGNLFTQNKVSQSIISSLQNRIFQAL